MKFWQRARSLWPRFTLAPILPFWLWAAFCAARGELRGDHVALALVTVVLAYGSPKTKRLYLGLLPMGLVALFYDAMRFVKNVGLTPQNVHLCDLRAHELRWFGFGEAGARFTAHDWLQAHSKTWLDLLCAIPYGTFIYVIVGYAVFLFFTDFAAQQRFTWGFFVLNLAGFTTYHLYPAAPPWYFHQHGCAVDLGAAASAGPNLLRVDALLGIHYFQSFYGRASDVFGAVPSLHVAYPFLMILEGWPRHRWLGRLLLLGFYLLMGFSAVYLDHHWIIDAVVGSVYALVTFLVLRRLTPRVGRWLSARAVGNTEVAQAAGSAAPASESAPWR
jgi:membrane-associated phospholipid phosphatase